MTYRDLEFVLGDRDLAFVRACVAPAARSAAAFAAWLGKVELPLGPASLGPLNRLLPMLDANLGAGERPRDPDLNATLRAARLHERARSESFFAIAGATLSSLTAASVAFLVGRGPVLACRAYPEIGLRHCHDLDLIVPDPSPARILLTARGFAHTDEALVHPAGLQVRLHTALGPAPLGIAYAEVAARAVRVELGGGVFPALAAADIVLQCCVLALTSRTAGPQALCDLIHAVRTLAPDWDAIRRQALGQRLGLAVAAVLAGAQRELGAAVPVDRPELESTAPDRETYYRLLRARRGLRALLRHAPARDLPRIFRWLVAPVGA